MPETFADIILPLPLQSTFTYGIPPSLADSVRPGFRVIVPFGARKYYTGIVIAVHSKAPSFAVKYILAVQDSEPVIRHPQLRLWDWVADYYMCTSGEVMKAALPAGLKIESETTVEANPDFDGDNISVLTDEQLMVYQRLATKGKMSAKSLAHELNMNNVDRTVYELLDTGAVIVSEKLVERYRPIRKSYVSINAGRGDEERLHELFSLVKSARMQERTLVTLMQLSDFMARERPLKRVTRKELTDAAGVSSSIIRAMLDKGVILQTLVETSRFNFYGKADRTLPTLSEAQNTALDGVHQSFKEKSVVLLHGVTSSGKTEIYLHLIDYVLRQGRQVLFLVPEIALTTQLTTRIQRVFGEQVIVYHSKFSDSRRVETWRNILSDSKPKVVIGARSAVFLPFADLGLVIVDEEHEQSYKQFDPAPRYNGRDVAMVLASMHGAKTLLGSATPSVETYHKALSGKFGLVTLTERYAGVRLPKIDFVDLATARKRGDMLGALARQTVKAARETIAEGRQVIFFHNRRGYAPVARCRQCQYIVKCENCDVSMTYHRTTDRLECHYCGATAEVPKICPVCKSTDIDIAGYGTERVEDDIEQYLPGTRQLRMDLDTTRNKDGYEDIIDKFSSHKADVLVGTQMVTKGLDFSDVSTVVVLNADAIINFPDFRSAERAFNMLEQVSGRAGRRADTPGQVLIQTYNPTLPLLQRIADHDYESYFRAELDERLNFGYPPFTRLIYIYLKHRDFQTVLHASEQYAHALRGLFGNRVFGPETPQISRIQNMHIRKIMLKFEPHASMTKAKEYLKALFDSQRSQPSNRGITIYYDVDPL